MIWSPQPVPVGAPAELLFIQSSEGEGDAHSFSLSDNKIKSMEGFTFELFGRLVDEPAIDYWQLAPTGGLDHALSIEVWWLEVPINRGMRALRIFESLTGQTRKSVEVEGDGWDEDWERRGATRVKKAIKALDLLLTKPGPKKGTGAKYKSADAWRAAIREKVLTRPSRTTVPEETIASWLGISRSLMFQLMARWGPKTLEDMLNGKL